MNNNIQKLDSLINEKRSELYEALQSGVSNGELETLLGENYQNIPETLIELWSWRNGQDENYSKDFHPTNSEMFMSLENSIDTILFSNECYSEGDISSDNWNQNWLPFNENGGGNYTCVSLETGEVYYYDKYSSSTDKRFNSIDSWLESVINGYKGL